MTTATRTNESKQGWLGRVVVWFRDQIVAKVIVGVAVAAALIYLGLNGPRPPDAAGGDQIQVANVYNLPRARGLEYIAKQGFANVRLIQVCSNSVAGGNIREVLLDDGAGLADETVFVGPLGSKPVTIPLSTKLLVKVSNGKGCS